MTAATITPMVEPAPDASAGRVLATGAAPAVRAAVGAGAMEPVAGPDPIVAPSGAVPLAATAGEREGGPGAVAARLGAPGSLRVAWALAPAPEPAE